MTATFTVTDPTGRVHKRTSENREYQYAVLLGPTPREAKVIHLEQRVKAEWRAVEHKQADIKYLSDGGLLHFVDVGFGGHWFAKNHFPANDEASSYNERQYGQHFLVATMDEASLTEDEFRTEALAQAERGLQQCELRVASLEKEIAKVRVGDKFLGDWQVLGWCSRIDLAQKLSTSQSATWSGGQVAIIQADRK
ncbi:hypothetical protein UFOVP45_123 [uncultured Caudovirales phage]|uniref:Uncharacterized protein n=1 Tax=uncultured Caudovirales phage TaxID=2100421 RepID=A0A6J5KS08_9CAUD|nr:hypothetical protein UFOVP45_123 [uncultured Caudovirales phage]